MTNPEYGEFQDSEHIGDRQLITDLLPRYYEAYGEDTRYEIVRSFMVNGHEVAWMQFTGTVQYDITGQGREGEPYTGHDLHCACYFTENVGWFIDDEGRPSGLIGKDRCGAMEEVIKLRHLELQEEYKQREMLNAPGKDIHDEVEAIMFDLIEKVQAGEFLEGHGGAQFWGGYYYLQTVASITGLPMRDMWPLACKLIDEKKIGLEGAVIQPYIEPSPPSWEAHMSYELDGWVATAALPTHSKMPQEWKFEVTKPGGEKLEIEIPNEPLSYEPIFGPDVDDVRRAQERLVQIVAEAMQSQV